MTRRAVIYIRTSSETQGENSSPIEQEADCRRLAHEKGLDVVCVYRDVERYRAGNKLVEPSGSRSDRPDLLAMLKDAARDEFDVILVWREDRLYRGLRSMLTVLETVQNYQIERVPKGKVIKNQEMRCPNCEAQTKQVKNGFNGSGSQKYLCKECGHKYTPEPKANGYPAETLQLAIRMYVEGNSYGSITRILKVNPQSVANWIQSYSTKLPPAPLPAKVKKAELDELYTFVGKKKTKSTS